MNMNEYQTAAASTVIFDKSVGVVYTALGLTSEAGEVAGKIKKVIRDKGGVFSTEATEAIKSELGDVLWYVACLSSELGLSLDDVAASNVAKLSERAAKGTLNGSGDNR